MNKKYYLFKMKMGPLTMVSFILFFIMIGLTYLLGYIESINYVLSMNIFLLLIIYFSYLFLHELLHSFAYVIYGGKYNKITYGISLELGVLYCLCKQNISKKNILHSLMYPFIFIGIITYIISIIFNLPILLWLSIFNISGCSGDIIMFIFISKLKNIEFSEMDDPISFAIYSKNDVSKISHYGLEYIGEKVKIERNDFTKIKVSKQSYYILAIMIILSILFSIL